MEQQIERLNQQIAKLEKELNRKDAKIFSLNEEYQSALEELQTSFDELQINEEKYRLLYENAGINIGFYQEDGTIISLNSNAAKYLKGKPSDFTGKTLWDVFSKDLADEYFQRIKKTVDTGKTIKYDDFAELPIGKKWFDTFYTPILNHNMVLQGIQVISTDVSELKNAQIKLENQNQQYETLNEEYLSAIEELRQNNEELLLAKEQLENSEMILNRAEEVANQGSFRWNIKNNGIHWSKNLYHVFRRDPVLGPPAMKWHENLMETDVEWKKFNQVVEKAIQNKTGYTFETTIVVPEGEKRRIRTVADPDFDLQMNFIGFTGFTRDINEQYKARQALKQSEERFRGIYEQATAGIAMIDPEGKIMEANPVFCQMLGYTKHELIGKKMNDLTYTEDRQIVISYEQDILAGKRDAFNIVKRLVHKDGHHVWVNLSSNAVRNDESDVRYIIKIAVDISERKKTEKELFKYSKLLEAVIRQAPFAIHIIDGKADDMRVIIENEEARRIAGKEIERRPGIDTANDSMLACRYFTMDGKIPIPLANLPAPRALQGEVVVDEEYIFKHRDGKEIMVNASAYPVYDMKKSILAVVAIFSDITERKKSEKQLLESEYRYKKLFEHIHSGVAIYKAINNGDDFQFIDFNRTAETVTRVKRHVVIGKTLSEEFPNMRKTPLFEALRNVYRTGEDIHLKPFYYKDDKRKGWRQNYIYKLPSDELVAVFADITEIKTAEKQLLKQNHELITAKNKAEESDRLKTAFLNNISHEFRTPLNGILGFADMLMQPDKPQQRQEMYKNYLQESCDKLLDIVTDTIEIAQIQSQSVKIRKSKTSIRKIINDISSKLLHQATHKELEIKIEPICRDTDMVIETDGDKLCRILKHLLENAVKFTYKGYVELKCEKNKDNELMFTITDTGIGIPDDQKQIIFEPFRQVEVDASRNPGGNGLGLTIVKAYVEMLGGQIHLQSQKGEGTMVTFTIPVDIHKDNGKSKQMELKPTKNWSDKTILIAEDEEINFLYLKELLLDTGVEILQARNGCEAVDICKSITNIDLILMDIKMPEMNGYEAAKAIREFKPDVPVIAQTAYALQKDINKIKQAGFSDFIAKPLNEKTLLETVNKYI